MNNTPLNTHLRQATVSSRFSSHPMANEIKSLSKEQLLNRKKYVEIAINFWTENKEQAPKDRVDYNLYYFKKEMNLINKRLGEA